MLWCKNSLKLNCFLHSSRATRTAYRNSQDTMTDSVSDFESTSFDSLGDRMKSYELQSSLKLDPTQPFLIRLDGHKFSNFTRPFRRPFDDRIADVMEATAKDLLTTFSASTVFTCSDEITLVFPNFPRPASAEKPDELVFSEPPFGGKVQKLASVAAGYASVSFDRYMREQMFDPETEAKLIEHVRTQRPYFDGRVFSVPSRTEIVNNLVWRSHYDFRRNSVSMLGRAHFSSSALHKLPTAQVIQKLKDEKQVDWHSLPDRYKYGSYIKKQRFWKATELPNGQTVNAMRSKPAVISVDIHKYTLEFEDFLCGKYLPDSQFDSAPETQTQ